MIPSISMNVNLCTSLQPSFLGQDLTEGVAAVPSRSMDSFALIGQPDLAQMRQASLRESGAMKLFRPDPRTRGEKIALLIALAAEKKLQAEGKNSRLTGVRILPFITRCLAKHDRLGRALAIEKMLGDRDGGVRHAASTSLVAIMPHLTEQGQQAFTLLRKEGNERQKRQWVRIDDKRFRNVIKEVLASLPEGKPITPFVLANRAYELYCQGLSKDPKPSRKTFQDRLRNWKRWIPNELTSRLKLQRRNTQ